MHVCITGIGVLLAGCDTRETLWHQLSRGESQLRLVDNPNGTDRVPMGYPEIDEERHLASVPARFRARYSREMRLYLAALIGALGDADLDLSTVNRQRVGLFDGVSRPCYRYWHESGDEMDGASALLCGMPGQPVGVAASLFGVQGPAYTYTTTCASGAVAIGQAWMHIRHGMLDVAIAGGHEASLVAPLYEMYGSFGLLSERRQAARSVAPWVEHSANVFGEGAIMLVLESEAHARARGATVLATLRGFAAGNTGGHPTDVDAVASRPTALIRQTLREAELEAEQVAFVVGHGNAVRRSDISEQNYMRRVFGRRSKQVPLLSVKPIYGHTLGASSALNVAAAALMVAHDFVIPTINVDAAREQRAITHMPNRGEARACGHGLAVSYGMGGQNAVVLVSKPDQQEAA